MRRVRDTRRRGCFRYGYVSERIKKLDRQLKFLVKKFGYVGHTRGSAAKKDAVRPTSLLLRPIMTDRAHQLRMQSGHGAARQLRDAGDIVVRGVSVGASQTYKAVSLLASFCRLEGFAKFFGNCSGDRTPANGKTSRENSARLDKENIGCARPDIHEQRAVVDVGVTITKRIVECHRRHIDSGSKQPSFFRGTVNSIK